MPACLVTEELTPCMNFGEGNFSIWVNEKSLQQQLAGVSRGQQRSSGVSRGQPGPAEVNRGQTAIKRIFWSLTVFYTTTNSTALCYLTVIKYFERSSTWTFDLATFCAIFQIWMSCIDSHVNATVADATMVKQTARHHYWKKNKMESLPLGLGKVSSYDIRY